MIKLFDPYRCQELQQLRQQYHQPELQVHVVHLKIQHGQQCLQTLGQCQQLPSRYRCLQQHLG
ncbi:hypothetical protein D3C78_164850 [compost metagenome]